VHGGCVEALSRASSALCLWSQVTILCDGTELGKTYASHVLLVLISEEAAVEEVRMRGAAAAAFRVLVVMVEVMDLVLVLISKVATQAGVHAGVVVVVTDGCGFVVGGLWLSSWW